MALRRIRFVPLWLMAAIFVTLVLASLQLFAGFQVRQGSAAPLGRGRMRRSGGAVCALADRGRESSAAVVLRCALVAGGSGVCVLRLWQAHGVAPWHLARAAAKCSQCGQWAAA